MDFQLIRNYHGRPDGESWSVVADNDADAVAQARKIASADIEFGTIGATTYVLLDGDRKICQIG